jgi:ubiquinone/menaquinone biosynthesis C-methylase UbiE
MPTHEEIYATHATEYEALVSREDHEGNILRALLQIAPYNDRDVVDLGAGTGRLAGMLAAEARSVLAFDLSVHMLGVARRKLARLGPDKPGLAAAADHRRLPLTDGVADLVVSGWSISYVATWNPGTWREELNSWLSEAHRILRPGGSIVLFESLGTGSESPIRLPHLERFYGWLDEAAFENTWIRTDYRFETVDLAKELAGFFFGAEIVQKLKTGTAITLPECTGVWWKRMPV